MNKRREAVAGYLFAAPWLIGFSVFLAWPVVRSLYLSFCDYNTLNPPVWVGAQNYVNLVKDELFWKSLGNTLYYAFFAIPLSTVTALCLAMLLNSKVKGQAWYRTLFFLPSLIPAVPLAILFKWLYGGNDGLVNQSIAFCYDFFHLARPKAIDWIGSVEYSKSVLVLMAMWTVGNPMVIYLAGLQEVPTHLYEASDLDGATAWQKTINVTLPLISPVIMFNVIMGMIGALQYFTQAFILFPGGAPARSTYFYTSYIYDAAFRDQMMGYASAMGWILFLLILVLTMFSLRLSKKYVYYEA